jgi:hypothetical protein
MSVFLSKAAAEAEGFVVDTHVYPWFAYKGPRFRPDASRDCLTDMEADMLAALKEMVTWMPSGFAPQSKDRAMKMAYEAIRKVEGTAS